MREEAWVRQTHSCREGDRRSREATKKAEGGAEADKERARGERERQEQTEGKVQR